MKLNLIWEVVDYFFLKELSVWIKNILFFCLFFILLSNLVCAQANQQVKRYFEETISGQIIGLEELKNGQMLIATGQGLFLAPAFNKKPRQLLDYEISSMLIAEPYIIVVSNGNVLINKLDSLFEGKKLNHQFRITNIIRKFSLNNAAIPVLTDAIYYHSLNEIWLSTAFHGIIRLEMNQDSLFSVGERLYHSGRRRWAQKEILSNEVNTMLLDGYGNIWIGTANGLCIHRPVRNPKKKQKEEKWLFLFKETNIKSLVLRKNEEVWIVNSNKRAQTNLCIQTYLITRQFVQLKKQIKIQMDDVFMQTPINDMAIDNIGSVWFGSVFLGRVKSIANVERDSLPTKSEDFLFPTSIYSRNAGFTSNKAAFIEADNQGYIWIGTGGQGVFVLKKQPEVAIYTKHVKCHGESNGSITLTPIDGEYPFEIIYSSHNNGDDHIRNVRDSVVLLNLAIDTFEFQIVDAHRQDTANYTVIIKEPELITAKLKIPKELSYQDNKSGVAQVVNIQGGQAGTLAGGHNRNSYLFEWNIGNNIDTTTLNYNDKIPMGAFSVMIFDTLGCSSTLVDTIFAPQGRIGGSPHSKLPSFISSGSILKTEKGIQQFLKCIIPVLKKEDPLMSLKIKTYYPSGQETKIGFNLKQELLMRGINERRIVVPFPEQKIGIGDPYIIITQYTSKKDIQICK